MTEISSAQKQYIKELSHTRRKIFFWRIFLFIFFIGQWELCTQMEWINSFIFSSPSRLCSCLVQMLLHQNLLHHILITLSETLISFFIVVFLSLLTAIILWKRHTLSKILEPYMIMLNSLPKSALAPLLIVWLGANYKTIILTGLSVAIFGSIMTLYTGFLEADPEKIKLIQTLGGSDKEILQKVILPSNIPNLFSIMKVNIGLCLVGVIIGEFIAAKQGLGYLIIYGSQVFKMEWVLLSILILCAIAMLLYLLLGKVEKCLHILR